MASFHIYCPCKLDDLGLEFIGCSPNGSDAMPYLYWMSIVKDQPLGRCMHCAQTVRILGRDPAADRAAGLTKRKIRQLIRAEITSRKGAGDE